MTQRAATYTTPDLAKLERQAKQEAPTIKLLQQINAVGLPDPDREVKFHPTRGWRFDLAWQGAKVAVEIEGGVWTRGRHSRGAGFTEDCVKYNAAQLLGWQVYRFTTDQINSGYAVETIEKALKGR